MSRTWSAQQEAIFDWFERGNDAHVGRHLVVRARAGTGKSTTIREGVKRAPERSILIAAFSKDIQLAMERELGQGYPHVRVKTLHSVGYACVRRFRDKLRVEFSSERADALARRACGNQAPDAIVKLVSKLHTKGREVAPHAAKVGDLSTIAITFECTPDEQWERTEFGEDYVERKALEAMELAAGVQSGEAIDGSDMIFLPVRNRWLQGQFDLVVVDEAQDMTTAQLEIAQGVLNSGGRICVVGDDRQAIFGFRGADSGSLDRLKAELGAAELGLTTTYRCARSIVALARSYVPDFEAGPDNPRGEVSYLGEPVCHHCKLCESTARNSTASPDGMCAASNDGSHLFEPSNETLVTAAGPGDFILSRVNAPLVGIAMKLLRAGKRTRVAGRDIGKGLTMLIRKFKVRSVPDLLARIEGWRSREVSRLRSQAAATANGRRKVIEAKVEAIEDQADMLVSLTDGAKSTSEVEQRIEALFTDDGLGQASMITCSSVHRAKGLEANRVFLMQGTLRQTTREEENICYVAITRAKERLTWVNDGEKSGR